MHDGGGQVSASFSASSRIVCSVRLCVLSGVFLFSGAVLLQLPLQCGSDPLQSHSIRSASDGFCTSLLVMVFLSCLLLLLGVFFLRWRFSWSWACGCAVRGGVRGTAWFTPDLAWVLHGVGHFSQVEGWPSAVSQLAPMISWHRPDESGLTLSSLMPRLRRRGGGGGGRPRGPLHRGCRYRRWHW